MEAVFDTLKIYERLKKAELSDIAAKEIAEVFRETIGERLVTKEYLDLRLKEVEVEIRLLKWMVGVVLAGVISLVLKTFLMM
ncbi:MAG: DUF1640 domain-containing protein [Candidatus Hydrogenedentota bacterium]